MRRDYFICVFLLYVALSLLFLCFVPAYFTYNGAVQIAVVRDFSLIEKFAGIFYALLTLIVVPVYAGIKKRFWITLGASVYGFLAYLPGMFMPHLATALASSEVGIATSLKSFGLRMIYNMVNAPFGSLSALFGNKFAASLSKAILPVTLIVYALIQLFRFYRDAYVAEQLNPSASMDSTKKVKMDANGEPQKKAEPEVLGTVITAPASNSATSEKTAPSKVSDETKKIKEGPAPVQKTVQAPEKKSELPPPNVIQMPAPAKKESTAIPMPAPSSDNSKVVLEMPSSFGNSSGETRATGVRKPNISADTINLGPPPDDPAK